MQNRYSVNDSIFSMDYKIPYEKSIIEEHLEQSQEEINFIKIKLTEAYQKLEKQIKQNTQLEEDNEIMKKTIDEIQEKYLYQKKENTKLKETLQVILKNRKLLQEENQQLKLNSKKNIEKDNYIEELQKQIKHIQSKNSSLMVEVEQKSRLLRQYEERLKQQSLEKEYESKKQHAMANKIQILQQQITRITQEKYIQTNRLRHQLELYQRNINPVYKQSKIQDKRQQRKRQFPKCVEKRNPPKYDTRNSIQSQIYVMNKQNMFSQINPMQNNSLGQSDLTKWKNTSKQMIKQQKEQITTVTPISMANISTEDQQLTQYQMARKKAQYELTALEKIKRPSQEQRDKMVRLQREIYHLDSDIAGLKRKIRRKY